MSGIEYLLLKNAHPVLAYAKPGNKQKQRNIN